jgi:hypothetical protein
MENKEISAAELFVKAEQGIESLREEAIYNHNILVEDMNRNTAVTNKNIMIFKDSISSLENRMNNLENVVKVAVVVTVFCHIWKKMKKKRESGSDENQAENGQK